MRTMLMLLAASTALTACATNGVAPAEVAEQTATISEAAVGPVAPAQAPKAQIGSFGFDEAGMDKSAQPGDNFYQFANGTWAKTTQIPADRSNYGMFTMLEELSNERTREILEEAAKAPGSKIGDFYASYMDRAAVNAAGLNPLKPTLAKIEGIKSRGDFARIAGELSREGIGAPFGYYVNSDDKAPDQSIVNFYQAGLGLPDRDYYLSKDTGLLAKKAAYQAYLTQLLTLAGEENAASRAAAIVGLETRIANVHWTRVDSRDATKTYNKWAMADFAKKAPGLDWNGYFTAVGIADQPSLIVSQPSAIAGMSKILSSIPVSLLKDYLLVQTIDGFAPYLSDPFVDANFAFHGTTLNGTPENQALWKRGVGLVSAGLGEDVGKVYVQRYFTPEAKAAADDLVKNVIAAMDRRIEQLTWMAPETKVKARAKLAAFTPKIGYPDKWRDYSALRIDRGDLLGNVVRSTEFETQRQLNKLGKPVDRSEWGMTPMTINAYANFNWNEIVFPAAILQPPFFDPNADPAVNYGGIGAVIGHEISHHFDDQGSKYDASGALSDWWTAQDVQRFNALTGQLAAQYDQYEPLPGKHVNGKLTLGENIADLAGLTVAYDAYHHAIGGKDAPAIDGFSGDQRFYLGWAQIWRRNYREDNLIQRLLTDPHSPSEQRTSVVRNLDPWYAAYKPAEGARLYLAPDKRVRIW